LEHSLSVIRLMQGPSRQTFRMAGKTVRAQQSGAGGNVFPVDALYLFWMCDIGRFRYLFF